MMTMNNRASTPAAEWPEVFVDSHVHVFSRAMPFDERAWNKPDYEFTTEQLIATLDTHGIPFAIISAASLFGDLNDYTLAATTAHPRLRGTGIVGVDTSTRELQAFRDGGIVGIRLQWSTVGPIPDISHSSYRRLFYRLKTLGMHVEVVARHADLGVILDQLAMDDVPTVINHFGHPEPDLGAQSPSFLATLHAAERENVFVKLSAGFRLGSTDYTADLARRLLDTFGPERLFWGSDCPFVGREGQRDYAHILQEFRHWVPDINDRLAMAKASLRFYFG